MEDEAPFNWITQVTHSHMIGIKTTFHGPTNRRGSRVIADAGMNRRITIPYNHNAQRVEDAHAQAAQALCDKFCWKGELRSAGYEKGYYFIFLDK